MIKQFSTSKLAEWQQNYAISEQLPAITTSALIQLSELEKFVAEMKEKKADSVCIHLLRFTWQTDEPQGKKKGTDQKPLKGCEWSFVSNGKTQVALAISGAKNFKVGTDFVTTADDLTENGQILLLMPGGELEGPTGHNPPPKTTTTGK